MENFDYRSILVDSGTIMHCTYMYDYDDHHDDVDDDVDDRNDMDGDDDFVNESGHLFILANFNSRIILESAAGLHHQLI